MAYLSIPSISHSRSETQLRNRSGGLYCNKRAVSTSDRKAAATEQSGGHAKNQVQVLVTISVIALTKGIKACNTEEKGGGYLHEHNTYAKIFKPTRFTQESSSIK